MSPQEAITRIRRVLDQHTTKRFDDPALGLVLGEVAQITNDVTTTQPQQVNYVGSALAALDQALNTDPAMLSRNDAAARAQAFALLAIADELRQLRETRPSWPAADVAAHAAANREGRTP